MSADQFAVEATPIGAQTLVPGVVPISQADRLAWRAAAPLAAKKPQRPLDHGLFDLAARNQLSLFDQLPPPGPDDGEGDG
jgi:hypothetical protein